MYKKNPNMIKITWRIGFQINEDWYEDRQCN